MIKAKTINANPRNIIVMLEIASNAAIHQFCQTAKARFEKAVDFDPACCANNVSLFSAVIPILNGPVP